MEGDIRSSSSEISDSSGQSVSSAARSALANHTEHSNSSNSKENNVKLRSNSAFNSQNSSPKKTPNKSRKED